MASSIKCLRSYFYGNKNDVSELERKLMAKEVDLNKKYL